jgi:hypothetical protein
VALEFSHANKQALPSRGAECWERSVRFTWLTKLSLFDIVACGRANRLLFQCTAFILRVFVIHNVCVPLVVNN